MERTKKFLIFVLVILAVMFFPIILVLLGCAAALIKWIVLGLGVLLLPVIIGIVIGIAIKRR